jgi:hypothetical protein
VAGGGGPGAGSSGEARVLERRSRRGVGTGGQVDAVALERRGRRRGREGKKREGEKVGVPGVGVPHDTVVPWGLTPTGRRHPAAA